MLVWNRSFRNFDLPLAALFTLQCRSKCPHLLSRREDSNGEFANRTHVEEFELTEAMSSHKRGKAVDRSSEWSE
jgi:hypothetical protein